MRIHVDLQSHLTDDPQIVQVEKAVTPGSGGAVAINGKYLIPVPLDADFHVDEASYVLNGGVVDGGSVVAQGYAYLLAQYPQYGNVYFNPLLTDENVAELNPSGTFRDATLSPPETFNARFQTGREAGSPLDTGQMPTHTAILPVNSQVGAGNNPRPGLLITDPIDIGPYTLDCNGNEAGTDSFMLFWKLYGFTVTQDIAADYGAQAGRNEPALRMIEEVDQEPAGFSAYISTDGGANWCEVGLLEPVAFCDKTTSVMVAFRNDSANKVFLASFGFMF